MFEIYEKKMSYTDTIVGYIKAAVEIIPSIGPMLRSVKFEDYLPLTEIYNHITQQNFSGDEILSWGINYISNLTNNNIFICIRGRIIAERLRLTTKKNSKKRILFLELEHKFSKLKWNMNMTLDELCIFTNEFEKLYPLIEKSFDNFSQIPTPPEENASFREKEDYKNLCILYETDVNVYKNLIIDLIFFTQSQYDNYESNEEIEKYKSVIIDLFGKICLNNDDE